jgi:hypothetical protein
MDPNRRGSNGQPECVISDAYKERSNIQVHMDESVRMPYITMKDFKSLKYQKGWEVSLVGEAENDDDAEKSEEVTNDQLVPGSENYKRAQAVGYQQALSHRKGWFYCHDINYSSEESTKEHPAGYKTCSVKEGGFLMVNGILTHHTREEMVAHWARMDEEHLDDAEREADST